eukprot:scaffold45836_cov106-Cyclotella_meneghiniana.AAC.1
MRIKKTTHRRTHLLHQMRATTILRDSLGKMFPVPPAMNSWDWILQVSLRMPKQKQVKDAVNVSAQNLH